MCLEPSDQLFEHEHGPGNRRVESGGEPGAGACREKHPEVRRTPPAHPSDEVGKGRAHLHTRAFAAERQAGADCQHAADELDRYQTRGRRRHLFVQRRFDMRNAASRGVWRKPTDQPSR